MKLIIKLVFVLIILGWVFNGASLFSKVDVNDTEELEKYLVSHNFQHFEMQVNMTSFLQFGKEEVALIIYIDSKKITEKSYTYSLGSVKEDERILMLEDNDG